MSEHRLDRIVIERPRWGMRVSSHKNIRKHIKQQLQQIKYDYQEAEIGSLKPCYKETNKLSIASKGLSDHLAPLYRWLHSKVGESWDDVYSELSRVLEFNTLSGQHILSHVWGFVNRYVVIIDDIPYSKPYYYQSFRPLGKYWRGRYELYVHPDTKILCAAQPQTKITSKQGDNYLWIDKYHRYYKLNDIWYFVSFRDVPKPFVTVIDKFTEINAVTVWDVLQEKNITYTKFFSAKNKPIYPYYKHQCQKKEIQWIEKQITLELDRK